MANATLHVLLIEDNPGDVRLIREALREFPGARFRVTDVGRLTEALDHLGRIDADVVLLDLGLPDSTGLNTLVKVCQTAPEVPVVVLTSLEDEALGLEAVRQGADDYLLKGRSDPNPVARSIQYAIERKLYRHALQASDDRYSALIRHIPDVTWTADEQGRFLFVSPNLKKMCGLTSEEACKAGVGWGDRIHPDDRSRVQAAFRALVESGTPYETEYRLRTTRETWVRVSDRAEAPRRTGGRLRVHGVLSDVTRRWEAEEELRASRMRLQAIFDNAQEAIFLVSDQGVYVDANPAAAALTGHSREELKGMRVGSFSAPESVSTTLTLWKSLSTKGRIEGEVELRRRDGTLVKAEYRAVANVLPGLHLSILRDVTERTKAEEARARLAAVAESAPDAIVSKTPEGIVTSWNRGAETIFGYTAAEAVGKSITFIFPPDRLGEEADILRRVAAGEVISDYETRRVRKDGREIDVSLTISPIRDKAGRLTGISKIARDVTRHKRLEEQVRHSQKMEAVGRLAGGIAHDFNNLLTVISAYSDLLLQRQPHGTPGREELEEIARAGERAAALTRQLLAFSRKQILQLRRVDLNRLVGDMERLLRRVIGEDIDLRSIQKVGLGTVLADPGQLEQVVLNLAINARDAMPRGGQLTISTENVDLLEGATEGTLDIPPGRYVLLRMSDTGIGMDEATMSHLFEPFFTTKETGKGTGLGLSTVYGIVRQSNGHVAVESAPGSGTTFKIYLPRVAQEEVLSTAPSGKQHSAVPRGSETVLVVEDDPAVRRVACEILRSLGYNVLEAGCPKKARELIELHASGIRGVLTDIVMPGGGGRELAQDLVDSHPGLKVVIMSGYDESSQPDRSSSPAFPFLHKPFTPRALAEKMREVLDR